VQGTKRMLAAAQQAGVRRFIHIGTEAALVRGQHLRGVDETALLAFDSPYPYCPDQGPGPTGPALKRTARVLRPSSCCPGSSGVRTFRPSCH